MSVSVPTSNGTPYLEAVTYLDKGWEPLLLPPGEKFPPPKGRTGADGIAATRGEIEDEIRACPKGNLGVRMPEGVVGLDVDDYGTKSGGVTLAALEAKLGPLPYSPKSSSRDGVSGIRFYRVPADVPLRDGLDGIDIIKHTHRYAVVWPSLHPEGRTYRWEGDEVPAVADLPELPAAWLEELRGEHRATLHRSDLTAVELDAQWDEVSDGAMCSHMKDVLERAQSPVKGRHDTCRDSQWAIVCYARGGHPGGQEALDELRDWFVYEIESDPGSRRLGHDTEKEWEDALRDALSKTSTLHFDAEHCTDTLPELDDEDDTPEGDDTMTAPAHDDDETGVGRDGKIRITVSNKNRAQNRIREIIGTGPLSGIFLRGPELVYTPRVGEEGYVPPKTGDDGPAQVRVMDALDLKTMVEIRLSLGVSRTVTVRGKDGEPKPEKRWEPKNLSMESASNLYRSCLNGLEVPNLRRLTGVGHTPLIRKDGSILDTPGYDGETRTLYLPEAGVTFPEVRCDAAAVADAVALITRPVEQFPFVTETDRANWFGALFTPLLKLMYPSPYPMFVIDAPQQGSGKTALAKILADVHGGVMASGWPDSEAEVGKKITTILHNTTAPVVTFDNVKGKISSATLESLLTSEEYTDRLLGQNKYLTLRNDRLWLVTANNASLGGDLARRCYWVTINANTPRPYDRTGFKLNLTTWVPANRAAIVSALLTVIAGWVEAGRPEMTERRGDSFATWDAAMASLLSWAGISDKFGIVDERRSESEDDREWLLFLEEVRRVMGDRRFTARDLVGTITDSTPSGVWADAEEESLPEGKFQAEYLPGDLADKWTKAGPGHQAGFTKSLGKWMSNRANRYAASLALGTAPNRKGAAKFWVMEHQG
ncbi:bifunctional DNA primase/polymerase [Actinocorallia aurantiaca]